MADIWEVDSAYPADEPFVFGKKNTCPICNKEFKNARVYMVL